MEKRPLTLEQSRHSAGPAIDVARIGNEWLSRRIVHEGAPSELHVRKVPDDCKPKDFPFIALAFLENDCERRKTQEITKMVQTQLESGSKALLVAMHYVRNERVYWYAYAGSKENLQELFADLGEQYPMFLGVNEDAEWKQYQTIRNMVGA
jgi:hypothetical protein